MFVVAVNALLGLFNPPQKTFLIINFVFILYVAVLFVKTIIKKHRTSTGSRKKKITISFRSGFILFVLAVNALLGLFHYPLETFLSINFAILLSVIFYLGLDLIDKGTSDNSGQDDKQTEPLQHTIKQQDKKPKPRRRIFTILAEKWSDFKRNSSELWGSKQKKRSSAAFSGFWEWVKSAGTKAFYALWKYIKIKTKARKAEMENPFTGWPKTEYLTDGTIRIEQRHFTAKRKGNVLVVCGGLAQAPLWFMLIYGNNHYLPINTIGEAIFWGVFLGGALAGAGYWALMKNTVLEFSPEYLRVKTAAGFKNYPILNIDALEREQHSKAEEDKKLKDAPRYSETGIISIMYGGRKIEICEVYGIDNFGKMYDRIEFCIRAMLEIAAQEREAGGQYRQQEQPRNEEPATGSNMSYQDALQWLELEDEGLTFAVLKKQKRKLQMKVHPDQGGSNQMMKMVNLAFDVIKKHKGWK